MRLRGNPRSCVLPRTKAPSYAFSGAPHHHKSPIYACCLLPPRTRRWREFPSPPCGLGVRLAACRCMHMCPNARACTDMHAYASICKRMHAYACICIHMHAYACVCMHMHLSPFTLLPLQSQPRMCWKSLILKRVSGPGTRDHTMRGGTRYNP